MLSLLTLGTEYEAALVEMIIRHRDGVPSDEPDGECSRS